MQEVAFRMLVGESPPMIDKLFGHNHTHTTARYAHLANGPVKSAANRIASRIADVTGQGDSSPMH